MLLQKAKEAAVKAGEFLRSVRVDASAWEWKGPSDLVSWADRESERIIREILGADAPLLGEEGGGRSGGWLVDPLDGTTNFLHGYPHWSVSIAFPPEGIGVVYDPLRRELFEVAAGVAFCNGTRLRVTECETLARALLGSGFAPEPPSQFRVFEYFQRATLGVRRDNCCSLSFCYVAAGRLDGFWEIDLKPWDVAAGVLLVEAAGGKIGMLGDCWVVSNGKLHDLLEQGISANL